MTNESTHSSNSAARAEKVTKVFGAGETLVKALDEVTVIFGSGAFSAIMGPSGSGKSTLLHCLAGLEKVTAGSVHIGSQDISAMNDKKLTTLRRDRVGFIFQSFNLVPTLTAYENIVLPSRLAGREPDKEWVNTVISSVDIGDRLSHRPSELSGGQQQRVAAARAFASKPDVVFADEPTGNLDSKSGESLLQFMRDAVDKLQQTIVMVTHDPRAAAHTDRVVFLGDGKIVDDLEGPNTDLVIDRMKKLGN